MSIKRVRQDLRLWGTIKSYEYEECGFNHVNVLHYSSQEDKKKRIETIEFMKEMDKRVSSLPDHLKSAINTLYVRKWSKSKAAQWLNIPVKTFEFWIIKSESELMSFY